MKKMALWLSWRTQHPISYDIEATIDDRLVGKLVRYGVPAVPASPYISRSSPTSRFPGQDGWASYLGMIDSGEPDLAERSEEILRQELGGQR